MQKFIKPILIAILGILIGAGATFLITNSKSQPITFNITTTDSMGKMQNMSYSIDKLPQIKVSQTEAIRKFKSLYSAAEIKSIALSLDNERYVYNIIGFDNRKDCTMQIDATNNKILGQSTQVLDYDYEKSASLDLNKTISRKEATTTALKEYKNATPIYWELEEDNDQSLWKIYLVHDSHKYTVKIDAKNKNII